jgi:hypothetical protein
MMQFSLSSQLVWGTLWILATTPFVTPSTTVPNRPSASYGVCFCCDPGPWFWVLSWMEIYHPGPDGLPAYPVVYWRVGEVVRVLLEGHRMGDGEGSGLQDVVRVPVEAPRLVGPGQSQKVEHPAGDEVGGGSLNDDPPLVVLGVVAGDGGGGRSRRPRSGTVRGARTGV